MFTFEYLVTELDRAELNLDSFDDRFDCLSDWLDIDTDWSISNEFTHELFWVAVELYEYTYHHKIRACDEDPSDLIWSIDQGYDPFDPSDMTDSDLVYG